MYNLKLYLFSPVYYSKIIILNIKITTNKSTNEQTKQIQRKRQLYQNDKKNPTKNPNLLYTMDPRHLRGIHSEIKSTIPNNKQIDPK